MTMLPQANARLLSVTREVGASDFTEDYDRPATGTATGGTVIWIGNIDAYVQQKIVSGFNDNGELRRTMRTTLYVTSDLATILQAGDTVTVSAGNPTGPSVLTARIQDITNPALLPQLADYYVCSLEEVEAQP